MQDSQLKWLVQLLRKASDVLLCLSRRRAASWSAAQAARRDVGRMRAGLCWRQFGLVQNWLWKSQLLPAWAVGKCSQPALLSAGELQNPVFCQSRGCSRLASRAGSETGHTWSTAWRSPTARASALVSVHNPLAGYPRCPFCSVREALVSQNSVDGVLSPSVVLQVVEMAPRCAVPWTAEGVSLKHR